MKKILLLLPLIFTLNSCEKPLCGCVMPPLSSELMGRWEWVKTTTPSRTLTPGPVQDRRVLEIENNGSGDYLAFYRNDTLQSRLLRSGHSLSEDRTNNTVLGQYGKQSIKFYLTRDRSELQTSELLNPYSEKADTVRHVYRYIGRGK